MTMLTVAQVAARLNVSRSTVRRLKEAGSLEYVVIAEKCLRFPESAVEAYLQRVGCQSVRSRTPRAASGSLSSSRSAEIVFSDGSRPARRKPRRFSLKLVSATSSSTNKS